MYNDTVLGHFANPRNVGSFPDADGIGESGNPVDGDKITINIKVQNGILSEVRFKTFGCGAAIAASSMLTVLVTGKNLADGLKITNDDVAVALGGLPPQKLMCSNIAADALHDAINNYLGKIPSHTIDNEVISKATIADRSESMEITESRLSADQINRYLRHIIMPNIGGTGQQKLLTTHVLICAPSMETADVLLSYLVSAGIGHISCFFEKNDGWESGLTHFNDLNPDVSIQLTEPINQKADFNIIIGDFSFLAHMADLLIDSADNDISPTFIALVDAWQGCLNRCCHSVTLKNFIQDIEQKVYLKERPPDYEHFAHSLGITLSNAFMGSLLAIELIKARLLIGVVLNNTVYFDLWNTSFDDNFSTSDDIFRHLEYRPLNLKNAMGDVKILIIGAGGLGCPAALILAKAGIQTIGLIDFDHVEISNLNRQILHTTSKIGMLKVESAKQALEAINPNLCVNIYKNAFSRENARAIIRDYDFIIDGLDNLPTRYLLNDACFFEKKTLIEAGALSFYGQVTAIMSQTGPCYRCLFPESSSSQSAKSCSETGVLGPVPGLMGILEAVEAIKLVIGLDSHLKDKLLLYDALETSFDTVQFHKNPDCLLCGSHPTIHELGEYSFICEG